MVKTTINKINLLLLLTLCLGYASTLYGVQNEVDDEKEAYPADNDAYNKGQHNKTRIIKRPTADFQPLLQKGRPPGGASMDIQYFRDKKSGKIWIGKCNINAYIGASNDEEYREALGLAIYRFFGIITPDFAVSVQRVAPSVKHMIPDGAPVLVDKKTYYVNFNRPCIHIMTQFLEGFSTCGDAFKEDAQDEHKDNQAAPAVTDNDSPFMRAYKRAAKAKQPFYLEQNGKKYPLQGLGAMLALANFIYDMDCIGKSGTNLGYLIKGNHAQVVKIDPGYAFSFLEEHGNKKFKHNPMDRKTFFGTDESATLGYDQLTPDDQQAFAAMAKRILQTPRKALKQLIYGVVVKGGWQKEMANKLLDHLIARKSLFLAAFAPEIDDNLRKEIMGAKHRLVATLVHQKGTQKQSKEQIEAYQKTLKELRAWEAKVAYNQLKNQKKHPNHQPQKPLVGEIFQLPSIERGDLFTGRQQERAALASFFGTKRKKPCAFQAITGVGGLGKTHLALHYAHACADGAQWIPHRYDAILWLYAEAGLDSQFHELAKAWKKECKTTEEAVAFVYMALQKRHRTLLVFDNAEQSQAVVPYLPPQHQKGLLDIILTTRNPALNLLHHGKPTYITLAAFTKKETRLYAQKVLGDKGHSQQAMDALWETVSGLPLALNHALQYIAKGECTLEKYPARFAEHQLRLGAQLHASPVVTSVLLSVLTLREAHPIIEPLLVTAAYLAPENIPTAAVFTLLDAAKQTKQQPLVLVQFDRPGGMVRVDFADGQTFNCHRRVQRAVYSRTDDIKVRQQPILAVLHKYGLLTLAKDGQTFDFHRLVQQVLREWHLSKKGKAGHEALLKAWMVYFDTNLQYDDRNLTDIRSISSLVPHACAIADADSNAAAIQKAQADLYAQIGRHQLFGVAHYDRAKQCYQKALAIEEKHYGAGHIKTADTVMILGSVLRDLGDYAQAKQCLEKALRLHTQHYGVGHIQTANTMNNLGNVHFNLGDYAQAKQCYQKALKINEKHYGAHDPATAAIMINLGNVLRQLGDYTAAKRYLQKALKINEKHYGADHPQTASAMINLGIVLIGLDNYAEAKKYLEKGLKIFEQHYGADHPQTATPMINLGNVLRALGDYTAAKKYLEKGLKIFEQHYGTDHPTTAIAMSDLGEVLANLGDYAQAKTYFQKVLKTTAQHYGDTHPKTATSMNHLGEVFHHLGDYAQAKTYLQKALKIRAQHYGGDHPETATSMNHLGEVFRNLGDYAGAKTYYQKALKIFEKHYGADHPRTAMTMGNLGIVLSNVGDYAGAKTYYQKALKIFEKHYGADHPHTAMTMGNLGSLFKDLGEYEKARAYCQQTIATFTKHYGANHAMTKKTKHLLAKLKEEVAAKRNQKQPKSPKKVAQDNKKHAFDKATKINELISLLPLRKTHTGRAKALYTKLILADTPHNKLQLITLELQKLRVKRTRKEKFASWKAFKADKLNHVWQVVKNDDYLPLLNELEYILSEQIKRFLNDNLSLQGLFDMLESPGIEVKLGTDSPKQSYKVNKRPKDDASDDEKENDAQHNEYIAPPKINKVKTQEVAHKLAPKMLEKKKKLLEKTLKANIKHYGPTHPQTASTMENLGNVLADLGKYAEAKKYYEKALKIQENHYGADDPETASTMMNLGGVLLDLGNYAEAKTYLEKALKINTQHYGANHPRTAITMGILGGVLRNLGDYAQAKTYFQKVLKIDEKHYGDTHPETAKTMMNLGNMLLVLGKYAEAKKYYEKALKIRAQHYGDTHPETARTMMILGGVLLDIGDYTEAKTYFQKELKIFEKHYGADHPTTAITINTLGTVLCNLGDFAEAKQYYAKALKIQEKHYGTDHPNTAAIMSNLGEVLRNLGDYASAKEFFQKALKIQENHYGGDHPNTAAIMSNLGNVFINLGDYAQAKTYFQKVLKIDEKHYGGTHPETAKTMMNLGNMLLVLGKYAEAKKYYEKALKIKEQHYGADHPTTAMTTSNLGIVFEQLGQYEKARECYQKTIKIYTQHYGPNHSETKRAKRDLAILEEEVAAKNNQKEPKTALGSFLNQVTNKPNKVYKVHKRPKDNASDDEKENDAQHNEYIAPPKINKVKTQEVAHKLAPKTLEKKKKLLEKTLKANIKHYGPTHPQTASTMHNLGLVFYDLGDYPSSKAYYEKALKIEEQHYGVGHIETASTMVNLGNVLADLGKYAEAKKYYEKALKIQENHYGADHPSIARTIENLGTVLSLLGNYAAAAAYYQKVLKIKEKHYDAHYPTTASTMKHLGNGFRRQGDYSLAKQCYEKALKIQENHYGADHPKTARTMQNLGTVLADLGNYAEAKAYFEKARKIFEKHYGADHPTTAGTMHDLGNVLADLGDYALAKQYYEKALKIEEKYYGAHHPSIAMTIGNLGSLFKDLGQYEKARGYYQKTIAIFNKHYGANHAKTKRAKHNLAILEEEVAAKNNQKEPKTALGSSLNQVTNKPNKVYKVHKRPKDDASDDEKENDAQHNEYIAPPKINKVKTQEVAHKLVPKTLEKKKKLLEKTLKANIKHYGPTHPQTASTMENLGNVLADLGKYAEAKKYYEKALKIQENHYGADDPETASTMNNLGNVLKNLGDYTLAKQYYEQALKIFKKNYGETHPSTAITMNNLGNVLRNRGDYTAAKQYLEKALKIHTQHYGAAHPKTATAMQNLGNVFLTLGSHEKAKQCYAKALKINEKHYGADHPSTAITMECLGNVLADLGDYALAKQYYEKALKIEEKYYGAHHPSIAMTIGNLGGLFKDLGQYEKAKECYQQSIKVFTQHYGPNHAMTKRAKHTLTTLEAQSASKSNQKKPRAPKIAKPLHTKLSSADFLHKKHQAIKLKFRPKGPLKKPLLYHIQPLQKPKTGSGNVLKNDDEAPTNDKEEVFDID